MLNKKVLFIGILLIAIVQLYVPAKMIYDQEVVLLNGNEYKFKAAPIDPNDPFRGKYITLRFEATTFPVQNINEWAINDEVFIQIQNDTTGFAQIKNVSKKRPDNDPDYIKAKIAFLMEDGKVNMRIEYPFDRFYMEETKAQAAEDMYRESIVDSTQVAYALVNIRNGEAVIRDVLINGTSISDLVKTRENK